MNDTPKVLDAPEVIWLNYGDIERDCTHAECYRDGDVTWCADSVFDSDVKYVRADRIAELEVKVRQMYHRPASEMREMLRAMQAGELTVSRGVELLEMWLAGNYADDQLPPVADLGLGEDDFPVDVIIDLRLRNTELTGELDAAKKRVVWLEAEVMKLDAELEDEQRLVEQLELDRARGTNNVESGK